MLPQEVHLAYERRGRSVAMDRIHALRYAVYCEEKGYLDASHYPGRRECDSFDEYSVHFVAYDCGSEIAGTLRLVIPEEEQPFPFEAYCRPFEKHRPPQKGTVAEISRLIIAPRYRLSTERHAFRFTTPLADSGDERAGRPLPELVEAVPIPATSASPRILLGLFRKVYRYSVANGITHLYAAMEASLARLLARFGIRFKCVSERVDYYGPVSLYFSSIEDIEASVERVYPGLLVWFKGIPFNSMRPGAVGLPFQHQRMDQPEQLSRGSVVAKLQVDPSPEKQPHRDRLIVEPCV